MVFGLAAQQTLGNLIAGVVLISARPFKVGDRVRLQSGQLAGELEGVVDSLGLLYTTFARGEDSIMVPNNIVLASAVVPLREPSSVDLRARLRPDVMPSEVQELLEDGITTPVRSEPHIGLEEIDKRRGHRPDRSDARRRVRRSAPRRRDPGRDRARHARGADRGAARGAHGGRRTVAGRIARPPQDPAGRITQEYES